MTIPAGAMLVAVYSRKSSSSRVGESPRTDTVTSL